MDIFSLRRVRSISFVIDLIFIHLVIASVFFFQKSHIICSALCISRLRLGFHVRVGGRCYGFILFVLIVYFLLVFRFVEFVFEPSFIMH